MEQKRGFYDIALFAATLLATVVASIEFIQDRLRGLYIPIIIVLLLLVWLYLIFRKRITKTVSNLNIPHNYDKIRKAFIILLPLAIIGIFIGNLTFYTEDSCLPEKDKVIVGIAKFSDDPSQPSYNTRLIANLRHKSLKNTKVRSLNRYIDVGEDENVLMEKLNKQCEEQCITSGIIAYGYWKNLKDEEIYDCYLFIKESDSLINNFNYPVRQLTGNDYEISLPRYHKFTSSADALDKYAEIINGIVLLYQGSVAEAEAIFKDQLYGEELNALQHSNRSVVRFVSINGESRSQSDQELLAVLYFYSATIELINDRKVEAIRYFRKAEEISRSLPFSIKSMATANREVLQELEMIEPEPLAEEEMPLVEQMEKAPTKLKKVTPPVPKTSPVATDLLADTAALLSAFREEIDSGASEVLQEEAINLFEEEETSRTESSEWRIHTLTHNAYIILRSVKTGHFLLANKKEEILSKPYDQIVGFRNTAQSINSDYSVVRNGVKYGFIRIDGAEIAEPQYEAARNFSNRLAAVKINGKWGFINSRNQVVIQPQFDRVVQDFFRETAVVVRKNKMIRINKKGKKLRGF